jgi:hypothetical protein
VALQRHYLSSSGLGLTGGSTRQVVSRVALHRLYARPAQFRIKSVSMADTVMSCIGDCLVGWLAGEPPSGLVKSRE